MKMWKIKTPNLESLHSFANKEKRPVAIKIPTYVVEAVFVHYLACTSWMGSILIKLCQHT